MSFLSSAQKALVDRIGDIVDDVEARMMLGTVGLFVADAQFGILEEEDLYLCVDDETRSEFAEAGAEPYGAGGVETASYLEVPDGVVEDEEAFGAWVQRVVEAAD